MFGLFAKMILATVENLNYAIPEPMTQIYFTMEVKHLEDVKILFDNTIFFLTVVFVENRQQNEAYAFKDMLSQ